MLVVPPPSPLFFIYVLLPRHERERERRERKVIIGCVAVGKLSLKGTPLDAQRRIRRIKRGRIKKRRRYDASGPRAGF